MASEIIKYYGEIQVFKIKNNKKQISYVYYG